MPPLMPLRARYAADAAATPPRHADIALIIDDYAPLLLRYDAAIAPPLMPPPIRRHAASDMRHALMLMPPPLPCFAIDG